MKPSPGPWTNGLGQVYDSRGRRVARFDRLEDVTLSLTAVSFFREALRSECSCSEPTLAQCRLHLARKAARDAGLEIDGER